MNVDRGTWIEELVRELPTSVGFLRRRGIRCIACGEPIWGTLEEAARGKGFTEDEIDRIVRDLRAMAQAPAAG